MIGTVGCSKLSCAWETPSNSAVSPPQVPPNHRMATASPSPNEFSTNTVRSQTLLDWRRNGKTNPKPGSFLINIPPKNWKSKNQSLHTGFCPENEKKNTSMIFPLKLPDSRPQAHSPRDLLIFIPARVLYTWICQVRSSVLPDPKGLLL